MVQDLLKFGIEPQKTGHEKLIDEYIPRELLRHTIRGLIDGDGWYSISNTASGRQVTSVGICGSYDICDYIQNYFLYATYRPFKGIKSIK